VRHAIYKYRLPLPGVFTMSTFGNPRSGILRMLLDVIYEHGQDKVYDSDGMTRMLVARGAWTGKSPRTPEKSVNAYFSQNPALFEYVGRDRYRLRKEHYRADMDLKARFDDQAMAVYESGKRELGYNGTRFLQKIRADGGLAAAKSWLRPRRNDKPTNGFLKLVDFGKLELSLEAVVLQPPWNSLFSIAELEIARKRLAKYGYFEAKTESTERPNLLPEELDDGTYREGAVASVRINRYERNPKARAACIEHYGPACYVCRFDFAIAYGAVFDGFIHVHHLCSLASIGADYEVDPIADLRPVCPNCHAIIHRKTPCYKIEDVRRMLAAAKARA
jgi:5-methylcytosine-specific restriction protein A